MLMKKTMMRLQREYVSTLSILPENIQKAVALVYDSTTGLVKDGVSTMNASYLGLSTTSNLA